MSTFFTAPQHIHRRPRSERHRRARWPTFHASIRFDTPGDRCVEPGKLGIERSKFGIYGELTMRNRDIYIYIYAAFKHQQLLFFMLPIKREIQPMDHDPLYICWRVWKWGQLWETNGFWSCPMIFGSQKACVTRFSYQPIHVASLFHHTLCVETSFGVSKRMASYVICFFGPCTCSDERGHLTDTYCLVSACVGFTPISAVSLPTLLLWCKSSGNQSNGCCGYSSFLDEFPMKCSHFGGYFPGTVFPSTPAAWSGPGGRGSCWGP